MHDMCKNARPIKFSNLELKTWLMQLLGSLPLDIAVAAVGDYVVSLCQ
jgi:hypothetical protein